MEIEIFTRKSFSVEAVRVTADNIEEVAKWCSGTIETDENSTRYIKVRVQNPLNERQTKAYVGDRVLYAGKGYKVYKESAFQKSFDKQESHEPIGIPPTPIKPVEEKNVFAVSEGGGGVGGGATTFGHSHGGSGGAGHVFEK